METTSGNMSALGSGCPRLALLCVVPSKDGSFHCAVMLIATSLKSVMLVAI